MPRLGAVSSAVEQLAFNQLVDGSIPSRPTNLTPEADVYQQLKTLLNTGVGAAYRGGLQLQAVLVCKAACLVRLAC
jgi:hypothetical protein